MPGLDPGSSFQRREIAGSSPAMTDEGMKVFSWARWYQIRFDSQIASREPVLMAPVRIS